MTDKEIKIELLRLYGCIDPEIIAWEDFIGVNWKDVFTNIKSRIRPYTEEELEQIDKEEKEDEKDMAEQFSTYVDKMLEEVEEEYEVSLNPLSNMLEKVIKKDLDKQKKGK